MGLIKVAFELTLFKVRQTYFGRVYFKAYATPTYGIISGNDPFAREYETLIKPETSNVDVLKLIIW